jgi:hypothetical protein
MFSSFWKIVFTNIIFLRRILYSYIVTLNSKLWIHLFWLYLKIFNIFVKKKKKGKENYVQCNEKYLAITGVWKMQPIRLGFEPDTPISSVRCSTNWASWPSDITCGWPLHNQTFTCTHFHYIFRHSGQFPKPLSPNMFLFHSHCVSCILRKKWVIG